MNGIDRNKSDRNTTHHVSDDDLMLFALQFLPEDYAAAVFDHLQTCEACRMALAELQGDLALVALTSEPHEVPAHAREQFLRRVAKEKKLVPIDRHQPEARTSSVGTPGIGAPNGRNEARPEPVFAARNTTLFAAPPEAGAVARGHAAVAMAWIGWAIAAAIAVFAFLQFQQRQSLESTLDAESASIARAQEEATSAQAAAAGAQQALETLTADGAMQVSLHLPTAPSTQPEAHAAYIASQGALVLVASHLHPLAAGKTYELWLLPAQANGAPIPAGTFKPDAQGYASVIMPAIPKGVAAKGFGVTVEPDGGSPAPTPPIVLAGL